MLTPMLFEPITIGGLSVKNRIKMPPMHTNLGNEDEGITDAGIDFYVARAKGGFGLVGIGIIDSYFVKGAGSPLEYFLENDRHIANYARCVKEIKKYGAVPYAQVLAVAFAFLGLKNILIYLFRAWEINRPAIVAEGMASLILLAGAYPVIQTWSALGLAVLMLVAQASSTKAMTAYDLAQPPAQITCIRFGWMNPWWAAQIGNNGQPEALFPEVRSARSQVLPPLYCPSGALWIAPRDALLSEGSFYVPGYVFHELSWICGMDIDDDEDLLMAKAAYLVHNRISI